VNNFGGRVNSVVQKIVCSDSLLVGVWQPLAVYAYLCLPRTALDLRVPSSELQLTHGFFDQTLAYVGVMIGLYHFFRLASPGALGRLLIRILIIWLHIDFLLRCGEASLMYQFDIGYSSLFFYHLQWESVRLALLQHWTLILAAACLVAAADWVFRQLLPAVPWAASTRTARLAAILLLLFGVRSAYVLHREWRRAPEDFAAASLALNWRAYMDEQNGFAHLSLSPAEKNYLRALGVGLGRLRRIQAPPKRPDQPLNLITIYLEGFQANFTQVGEGPFPGLTPNLDRLAGRSLVMSNFYNAVTPTINSLISSQCGILAQVENDSLEIDRGYTRNLVCLSDVLHEAGYHQEFFGGGDSGFAGKRLFLNAHHYDAVWGWEHWGENEVYAEEGRRNAWGLNDSDLIREAIMRLPALAAHPPFHLSLLTVDTHQPGYPEPGCPEFQRGRLMLNAIHCTDYAVGQLMSALETGGYLTNTAIIVMGDHTMFPTPEGKIALGPAAAGWFGKVFMALYWPMGPKPGRIDSPAYTPDFAPMTLDILGFRPLPRFAFGRSPISAPDPRRTLVAAHFQILNGQMNPAEPTMDEECPLEMLEQTMLNPASSTISPCARAKIIESVEEELLSGPARSRNPTN
jgi:phosphoglycerol transferase MdoB-like AlkP superfamily enzyme